MFNRLFNRFKKNENQQQEEFLPFGPNNEKLMNEKYRKIEEHIIEYLIPIDESEKVEWLERINQWIVLLLIRNFKLSIVLKLD